MVNFVYYQRARYEEKCCSQDSTYQEYLLYMKDKSIFAPIARAYNSIKKLLMA